MSMSNVKDFSDRILSTGEHCGFKWMTVHNGIGFRCGYIGIPKTHPWWQVGYDNIDVDVHGGLTFSATMAFDEPLYWIGFDCAHFGDMQDPTLPTETKIDFRGHGVVRTQAYVEAECKKLCEQALEKGGPP